MDRIGTQLFEVTKKGKDHLIIFLYYYLLIIHTLIDNEIDILFSKHTPNTPIHRD